MIRFFQVLIFIISNGYFQKNVSNIDGIVDPKLLNAEKIILKNLKRSKN